LQRYYTTAGFKGINWPLRDQQRRDEGQPHKLAVLVFILAQAIKKLRAWAANSEEAYKPVELFRGMSNRMIFDSFMVNGGTELAPMSAHPELWVELQYAHHSGCINTLLWIRTESFMDRGVQLDWLSAFPHDLEYLWPPLAFFKPIRMEPIVLKIGSSAYQIVEVKVVG
jgi:hypothetical protein